MTGADHAALAAGRPPLRGRTETWMEALLSDPDRCAALVESYGSPLNVFDFSPVPGHAGELVAAAAERGLRARVFVARKANKALGLVHVAARAGLGMDVASFGELDQCLRAGLGGDDLIVTAAVKSSTLLDRATGAGVVVSLDNADEAADVRALAHARPVRTALRLAVAHPDVPPSRFGLSARAWLDLLDSWSDDALDLGVEGVHFHLNGYDPRERAIALAEACDLVDALRARGHGIDWIDMGGGVPMSYLAHESQWREFWRAVDTQSGDEVTWRGDRLGLQDPESARPSPLLYPYWQRDVRGVWLGQVLDTRLDGTTPVSSLLAERGLILRLEPGRAVLDGCGVTLASVAFRKTDRDGSALVGLHMNRTQVRSTSLDFLVDPVWLRPTTAGSAGPAGSGFLVGAYCIEEELILRRRMHFPHGVARGDVVAFLNTAGYLAHIVESASHQLPLAANVVWNQGHLTRDEIDACADGHSFRRTVATEIDEVYDAEAAKDQLGHTSTTVTERHYINRRFVVPDDRAATERLAPRSESTDGPARGV